VVASNAWERAQEAIARASERDASVITPDTAVSPFDASSTAVIPHVQAARRSRPPDPDVTQRLQRSDGNGHRGTPPQGQPIPGGRHAAPHDGDDDDTGPEAHTDRLAARPTVRIAHPGTSPFPASQVPQHDETPAPEPPRRPWWRRLFG
jgi:hypothetical protein